MTLDRPTLPQTIPTERIIMVARGYGADVLAEAAHVAAAAGFHVVEVTLDSPSALGSIAQLGQDDALLVGAGTVHSPAQVYEAVAAGARFIVTPTLEEDVIAACLAADVPCIAGAFTPSEIARAWRLGASAVKVFPAGALGPQYLKALQGPLGDIPLIPTGQITGDQVPNYLDAGAVAVGLGGWLPLHALARLEQRCLHLAQLTND